MENRKDIKKCKTFSMLVVLTVTILMLFILMSRSEGQSDGQNGKTDLDDMAEHYTYEELTSMPDDELLDLFISCGLVVNDELGHLAKDKLAHIFKQQFDSFIEGITPLNYSGYQELARSTKEIYQILT